LTEQRAHTKLQ
jgi:hypothetical protein